MAHGVLDRDGTDRNRPYTVDKSIDRQRNKPFNFFIEGFEPSVTSVPKAGTGRDGKTLEEEINKAKKGEREEAPMKRFGPLLYLWTWALPCLASPASPASRFSLQYCTVLYKYFGNLHRLTAIVSPCSSERKGMYSMYCTNILVEFTRPFPPGFWAELGLGLGSKEEEARFLGQCRLG